MTAPEPAADDAAGLFGPGSLAWRVDREVLVLAGGSCALLMQAAHPAVAAGVTQHSAYRQDPFGRLLRTLSSSFAVVFGTRRQAVAAIRRVNAVHASVRGHVPETGEPYSALAPDALLWVHATLVDTALRIYDRFVAGLEPEEMEAYYRECAPVAELLGVPSSALPATLGELRSWMDELIGAGHVNVTPTARDIARTVIRPTRFPPGFVWDAAHLVSLSLLPDPLRRQYRIGSSASREHGVERLAAVTRRALPWVPPALRFVPHARSAEARVSRAHARVAHARAGARSAPGRRYHCRARSPAEPGRVPAPSQRRERSRLTRFAKLATAAAVATFVLIVAGGLVRATDSGLGCPDWPLCFGDWVPPADLNAWIEHTHRLVAAVFVGPLVAATALITVVTGRRRDHALLVAAVLAGVLVIAQSLLGAVVVLQGLAAQLVTAHLAMALTLLAATVFIAERAVNGPLPASTGRAGLTTLVAITAAVIFGQMLLGSLVTGRHAGLAYPDFPLMNGALLAAPGTAEQVLQLAHRGLAVVLVALVVATAWLVRSQTVEPGPRRLAGIMVLLVVVQLALGAANVWSRLSAVFVVPHVAVGAALWGVSVWLLVSTRRMAPAVAPAPDRPRSGPRPINTVRAYIALTKPRIIELLLVTTIPTMVLAEGGVPSPWLMAAVVIGGTMAAGGANAINQVVDRDIDDVMRRTRHRPLPRHAVTPREALVFGVALSIASFAWLTLTVNLVSALLAASAIGFYVFVYTLWLKRSTPHNIVIGGAAGCVPVLVAWAAVTGRVEVPALVLFAIVFYWTPPHFWALALRYRGDYAAAGVPMLPVVRGESETARRIVVYSIVLVAVSLLLLPTAGMGLIYLAAAAMLGAVFVWRALRLWRDAADGRAAIGLFRYSISYLTLLFAAVAVDALVRVPLG